MTRHEAFLGLVINEKPMVLATDLDGTFLGGTEEDREHFYGWLQSHRDQIGLIFVTGRDPIFITRLVRQGLPRPDYVVGDVGTTIAEFDHDGMISPIPELEAQIEEAWGNATPNVQAALKDVQGLTLQSASFRYRVSYDMDAQAFDPKALDVVAGLGLDALVSDNRYFDVLPKGISKGPSLLRLLAHLGIDHTKTLVAGDTLNDLSMLRLGVPAVAVGGSEPALIEQLAGLQHVHLAEGKGVLGIAEAIRHHGLFTAS